MINTTGIYRWKIVALLFFATTINYIDRHVIGILAPQLEEIFHWSEVEYGFIIMVFQVAYALGLIGTGAALDRIGSKIGYAIAVAVWSIAGIAHAFAFNFLSFAFARFFLGIGESANFPAAVKTVAEWFPKKERALATGIFNSGTNVAVFLTPLIIPLVAAKWGWQWAFISTGALGFIWLLFWIPVYRNPEVASKLRESERQYILQDKGVETRISWRKILTHRQTLGICLARFVADPVWWFFLYWLPKFLNSVYGMELDEIGLPIILIYVFSDVGSIAGGWFSSALVKRGKDAVAARKITIFFLALLALPVFFVSFTSSLWVAVALIALATFTHQGYAANIYTIVSDIYPTKAVGTMVGLSGFSGALGGVVFSGAVGLILQLTNSYYIVFAIASVAYLACWLVLKFLVPDAKTILIEKKT